MFDSNDEYDFSPVPSSKLASLFEATVYDNTENIGSNNKSLTYTAPKQPKKDLVTEDSSGNPKTPQSSVILANIVNLWKLDSSKEKQFVGKHGIAVIGNLERSLFECIIYKEKNNILVRVKLNENFTWYTYSDSFGAFYDDQSVFWMTKFSNIDDDSKFLNELVKCKCKIIKNDPQETSKVINHEPLEINTNVTAKKGDESYNSDVSAKASILSRITKMGQQILPGSFVSQTNTDLSDSELEETKAKKPVLAPRKFKRNQNASERSGHSHARESSQPVFSSSSEQPNHSHSSVVSQPVFATSSGQDSFQSQMVLMSPPMHTMPLVSSSVMTNPALDFNNYLLFMSQITAKLDSLLGQKHTDNLDDNKKNLKSKTNVLELRIENLMSELEMTRSELGELKKKYDEMGRRLENENEIAQKIDQKELELKEKLEELGVGSLEECFNLVSQNKNLIIEIDELNKTLEILKLKLKQFENDYCKTKKDEEQTVALAKSNDIELISEIIKKHMNSLYQQVMQNFDENDELFSNKVIQQVLVKSIKKVTNSIVSDLKHEVVSKSKILTD